MLELVKSQEGVQPIAQSSALIVRDILLLFLKAVGSRTWFKLSAKWMDFRYITVTFGMKY